VVEVKIGSWSTAHWSNKFIRLNGWLKNSFTQLMCRLDIDSIGKIWEGSNIVHEVGQWTNGLPWAFILRPVRLVRISSLAWYCWLPIFVLKDWDWDWD